MSESQRAIKILVVVDSMGLGGAQSLIIDFCAGYDRQCLDVLVCALGKRTDMVERMEQHGAAYRILNIAKWNPFCGRKLRQVAEKFKPDIIYAHLIKSLIAGSMLARHVGVPLVYHEHSDGTIRTVKDIAAWALMATILYRFKQRFAGYARSIIACGPKAADRMLSLGFGRSEQVHVVPNGIDLTKFTFSDEERVQIRAEVRDELNIPQEAVVVCNVGRFRSEKNWPEFLRVLADVSGGFPDLRILAVGSGALLEEMKALCSELGIEGRTVFTGFRNDVPRLLLASDIMVCTSVREGNSIAIQEAMVCGVPIVTYDVGETRFAVRENMDGHVVENGNASALADRLRAVLAHPAKRAAYSRSCHERAVGEFDVRVMVRRIELVLANARLDHARPRVLGR
ncbi:MAG: glycosyltransferase [Planctomycetota bacterium]